MFSEIDDFPDFTPEQKKEIKENLEKDITSLNKHEKSAEAQRYKKLWVQSTHVSDKIAKNSRLSEAIISSIDKSISNFPDARISRKQLKRLARSLYGGTVQGICKEVLDTVTGAFINCEDAGKYRSITGVCNNLNNKTFGSAGIAMRRFAAPAYSDGKWVMVITVSSS